MIDTAQTTDLLRFHVQRDRFFALDPYSPLTPAQRRAFTGLRYFSEEPALRFVVAVAAFAEQDRVTLRTSTGDAQVYRRYGRFAFNVAGREAALTLCAADHGFLLPFVDALAGAETYAAGRYLDPAPLADGRFLLDFNLAYNPYCAYNEGWSCPLTPPENRLAVPIRAGEQLFSG